uniref:Oligodendrocyte transcription factor 2 n=1 Tax=Magallana gigas TaxID=29159 RepID=K1Q9G2_MAGGI|nr:uncharacterized protein LOC117690704 [Crassostrea gigas]XP_034331122.1 uncharacterized protein LOC117690705 [Crassostrea gigas]
MSSNVSLMTTIKIEEEDSGVYDVNSSCDLSTSSNSSESRVPDEIRLRINSRERQRMHELNDALEALRSVLPQSQGSSLKKLSKLSTLVHAREHILSLSRSIDEMKRLAHSLSREKHHFPSIENQESGVPQYYNHPSDFASVGRRYAPYTSTPIKSEGLREMRSSELNILSPYLKYRNSRLNESKMEISFKENVNDSLGVGSTQSYSLSQYTIAPLDTLARNLPEFQTPTKYQNSSPTKPVLKFSVESLLGLSNKSESDSPSKNIDIMC